MLGYDLVQVFAAVGSTTHWPLGDRVFNLKMSFVNLCFTNQSIMWNWFYVTATLMPQNTCDDRSTLVQVISGWNCQPWPSRSQNWMFVYFIIILSRSQQFPNSSSQNQVELGEWATGHFMHWVMAWSHQATSHYLIKCWPKSMSPYYVTRPHELTYWP